MYQMKLIQKHFNFLDCRITDNVLVCKGVLSPHGCKNTYKIKIEYVAGYEPKSTVLYPFIKPDRDIHMYDDHSLCLHYPKDMFWDERVSIYEYTVPWIAEWIHYYELYLVNGNIWEGPESPVHFTEEDKNINTNID